MVYLPVFAHKKVSTGGYILQVRLEMCKSGKTCGKMLELIFTLMITTLVTFPILEGFQSQGVLKTYWVKLRVINLSNMETFQCFCLVFQGLK